MSFFKSIGKAFKSVAKVALPVLKIGAGVIPGVGGIASAVLNSKLGRLGQKGAKTFHQAQSTMQVLKASPVLPGGAVATPLGAVASSGNPPLRYAGSGGGGGRKRKRHVKRKTRRAGTKRRARKLKFGSAAYRRKYLGHR